MELKEEIKDIKFISIEDFNCSSILCFLSESFASNNVKGIKNIILVFIHLLQRVFLNLFSYEVVESRGSQKILFAFNERLIRRDIYDMFFKIFQCSNDSTFIRIHCHSSFTSLPEIKERITLSFRWWKQMKDTKLTPLQKVSSVSLLILIKHYSKQIEPYFNYDVLVTRYDALDTDNIVTQIFKNQGKITVTAQHGMMYSSRGVPFSGIYFYNSISDYFLAWNNMTKTEAIKDGLEERKIKVCGIARCIDAPKSRAVYNKTIGIVLDGYDYLNVEMIAIANLFCKKTGYKYYLRYHPFYKGSEYDSLVSKSYYLGNSRGSLIDYSNRVEFSIVANSTVLLELLYMKHRTYVFSKDTAVEIYYKYVPVFHNILELDCLISSSSYEKEVYDELVTVEDIRKQYSQFFKEITRD